MARKRQNIIHAKIRNPTGCEMILKLPVKQKRVNEAQKKLDLDDEVQRKCELTFFVPFIEKLLPSTQMSLDEANQLAFRLSEMVKDIK